MNMKRGEQPWPEVNGWRLRLHKEFDEAFASTQLPERPDYAWAKEFLLKARWEMVNRIVAKLGPFLSYPSCDSCEND